MNYAQILKAMFVIVRMKDALLNISYHPLWCIQIKHLEKDNER